MYVVSGLKDKIIKVYLKLLKAQVKHKWDKASKLNARYLELTLKYRNLNDNSKETDGK